MHTSLSFYNGSRPGWSEFMADVSVGVYPGKSVINFLPKIDLNPNEITCIYSTLRFVFDQSTKLLLKTAAILFEQPLWLKASEIVNAKCLLHSPYTWRLLPYGELLVVLRGLMKGAGLKEMFLSIYRLNAVEYVLSGKAVSRALSHCQAILYRSPFLPQIC